MAGMLAMQEQLPADRWDGGKAGNAGAIASGPCESDERANGICSNLDRHLACVTADLSERFVLTNNAPIVFQSEESA
jgi:hypothetical protein